MMKSSLWQKFFYAVNIIIVLVLFSAAIFGLWKIGLVSLPSFVTGLFHKEPVQTVIPGDDGKIYSSIISGKKYDEVKVYPNITKENLRALILDAGSPQNYLWETWTTVYADSANRSARNVIRYEDGNYSIESFDAQGNLKKVISDNKLVTSVRVYDNNGNSTADNFPSGTKSMFAQAGVPDIKSFLAVPEDAEYSFSQISSEYGSVIYISFIYNKGSFTQREVYYLSLDYGLVVRAESYDNDSLCYLMETSTLTTDIPDSGKISSTE